MKKERPYLFFLFLIVWGKSNIFKKSIVLLKKKKVNDKSSLNLNLLIYVPGIFDIGKKIYWKKSVAIFILLLHLTYWEQFSPPFVIPSSLALWLPMPHLPEGAQVVAARAGAVCADVWWWWGESCVCFVFWQVCSHSEAVFLFPMLTTWFSPWNSIFVFWVSGRFTLAYIRSLKQWPG